MIALGHAGLAALEGRRELAIERYGSAVEQFAELPMPLEPAQTLVAFGTYLRRNGQPHAARGPLAEAVAICEAARAERLARIVRAELAASGGRRRRRDQDGSALTAQEQRVAAPASEGLANGEIPARLHLSPKTVGFHLQRVYEKLGIHSRRELIRRADEFTSTPT